jgi:Ca2+-binding EF-hand superfamily protein
MSRQRLPVVVAALAFAGAAVGADAPPAATRADAVFAALDTDHDQVLSRQEFEVGYARVQQAIAIEARLRRQFAVVDPDHDGALDADEYARLALVARLGKAAPALASFDGNRDGKLGFDEYRVVVQRLGAAPVAAKE